MRIFNIKLEKNNSDGTKIPIDLNTLNEKDRIKFEMVAIDLFDKLVENDDCREAKEFIKNIQYSL
jgi:archaellum biogenesis ATPase FlaH